MKKKLITVLLLTSILLMTACGAEDTSDSAADTEIQYSEEQPMDDTPSEPAESGQPETTEDSQPEEVESSQPEAVDTEYENMLEQFQNCNVIFLEKAACSGEDVNLSVDVDVYSFVIDFERPSDFMDNKGSMDWIQLAGKESTVATKCDMYTVGEGEDAFYWGYLYLPQGTEPDNNIELVYYNFVKDEKIRKDITVNLGEYDFGTNSALICEDGKYFVCSRTTGITTGTSGGEKYTQVQYKVICLNDINYRLENTDDFVIRYSDELDEEFLDYAYSGVEIVNGSAFNNFYVQITCGAKGSQSEADADESMDAYLADAAKTIWDNVIIEFKGVRVN